MKRISILIVFVLLFAQSVRAQEDQAEADSTRVVKIHVRDLETLTMNALRREFPRLPGVLATVTSCRLPEYGPMVSIVMQIPTQFYTQPILSELERRQRIAEEQARLFRMRIQRATEIVRLRSREAGLVERISVESGPQGGRKQQMIESLEKDLQETRMQLSNLEKDLDQEMTEVHVDDSEVDLNRLLQSNYEEIVKKVSRSIQHSLAENAPKIIDLKSDERVSINAHIHGGMVGGKRILFVLKAEDIDAYRNGSLDLPALQKKVVILDEQSE